VVEVLPLLFAVLVIVLVVNVLVLVVAVNVVVMMVVIVFYGAIYTECIPKSLSASQIFTYGLLTMLMS
jgi:hypothetical protein